jgi:hypothetical protein
MTFTNNLENYWTFFGFENVYLEDSYLLNVQINNSSIEFLVETVLTENHPLYTHPLPNEQYCYKKYKIKFPYVRDYQWINKKMTPIHNPDGSVDYGNIDEFYLKNKKYHILGEWGELEIVSEPPILESL